MTIADNINHIQKKVLRSATRFGTSADGVELIAVSKKQPAERIDEALASGQRIFGENRVQEAQEHWGARRAEYQDLELHLIGPLQTNKAKDAVAFFDVIQTVDREKLARALSGEMQKQGRDLPCFIQVNTGEEEQKAGIALQDLRDFIEYCRRECGLHIRGLMCIPPVDEPAGLHFALLRKLALDNGLRDLSMGMSGDFEKAVPLVIPGGTLYIRVGTGVFGARA